LDCTVANVVASTGSDREVLRSIIGTLVSANTKNQSDREVLRSIIGTLVSANTKNQMVDLCSPVRDETPEISEIRELV